MTLVTAVAFKAAAATAAADLTTIWTDTVDTRTADDIRNPKHPLRQIEKLFLFNAVTGVVTSDDAYIDNAYAGLTPNKGNPFDVITDPEPITLTTATVEDAAQADIVLTFSRTVTHLSGVAIGGAGSAGKTIVSTTIVANVVTIVVSADYDNGDVITASGLFNVGGLTSITLTGESVTNNVI